MGFETDRHLYRVTDPRYSTHYRHSEAYFRAEMLLQILQVDFGVRYDMSASGNFSFRNSRVAFIHGMIPPAGRTIADVPGGTCASMPVMYVAVGHRLGYPLELATTRGHTFVRWDGKKHPNPTWRERFNIEGAGEGIGSFPDDHYLTWPVSVADAEVRADGYLRSLSRQEELAQFMAARGHCAMDNKQFEFAARCYENAYRCDPSRACYIWWFAEAAVGTGYVAQTPEMTTLIANWMRSSIGTNNPLLAADHHASPARLTTPSSSPRVDPWQPTQPGVPQTPHVMPAAHPSHQPTHFLGNEP